MKKIAVNHSTRLPWNVTLLLAMTCLLFGNLAQALDQGTTIIGTKEAPNVLNIVPWQDDQFTGDPWGIEPAAARSVLEDSQKPLDKDVLRREVNYFNLIRGEIYYFNLRHKTKP